MVSRQGGDLADTTAHEQDRFASPHGSGLLRTGCASPSIRSGRIVFSLLTYHSSQQLSRMPEVSLHPVSPTKLTKLPRHFEDQKLTDLLFSRQLRRSVGMANPPMVAVFVSDDHEAYGGPVGHPFRNSTRAVHHPHTLRTSRSSPETQRIRRQAP